MRSNAHVSRREHPGAVELAERERAKAERIAHADDFALAHHHEREGALDAPQRREHGRSRPSRLREQVQDDLAIDRRLENRAALLEFIAQHAGVDEIAVVPDRRSGRDAYWTISGCALTSVLEPVVE